MEKDILYIEPENDITDILTKLQNASQKIVALVPPKKNNVLRSAVNVKLIQKTAKAAGKTPVFVTTDPALIKLAAISRVPVAKNLQSRPEIPTSDDLADAKKKEQVIEEDLDPKDQDKDSDQDKDKDAQDAKGAKDKAKAAKNKDKQGKNKAKKGKDGKGKKVPSINKLRRRIIIGVILGILVIGFLIWAIFIAPAVKIVLTIRTTANTFSESASFVTNESSADPEKGRLYLEQQKLEQPASVKFQATGQKDKGDKASGTLTISTIFHSAGTITIPAGGTFVYSDMQYTANTATTISWNGTDDSQCDPGSGITAGCYRHATVNVTAAEPGTRYNIDAKDSGWTANIGDISVKSSSAMSGGTSNVVTVVQQSDVDKAKASLESANNDEAKATLKKQFKGDYIVIENSFYQDAPNPVAKPAVGEEVGSGVQPTLSSTATSILSGVRRGDLNRFIEAKSGIEATQRVYSFDDPLFDRFAETSNGTYGARVKTNYHVGPRVSEESVREQSKGHKFGEVKSQLNSINGVLDVDCQPSVFWVSSVPDNDEKVEIEIKQEDAQ